MTNWNNRVEIGTIRIPKGTEFENGFEVAAWHQRGVTTEDQTVTLYLIDGYWVSYGYDGVCTASDFSSLFCGNRVSAKIDEDKGKTIHHSVQTYAYSFAERYAVNHCDYRAQLNDEWGVKVKGIATRRDDAEYAMYQIVPRCELITEQHRIHQGQLLTLDEYGAQIRQEA